MVHWLKHRGALTKQAGDFVGTVITPLSPSQSLSLLSTFPTIIKMNSLRDEGAVDTNYLIRLFLDTPAEATPHVGASLVARLAAGTMAVFQDIQKGPIDGVERDSESQSYLVSLGRSSDRLRLWSDGYGISSGASDDLFERSSRLRGATLEILSSIGLVLTESKSQAY